MVPRRTKRQAFLAKEHDHAACIERAMADAAAICVSRSARLTPLRKRVLEIIWQSHRPLGAYDILEVLRRDGRTAAPPTVYRGLDFLLDHGLIHRIDTLNAFVGCSRPGHPGSGQFLICEKCGMAAEMNDARLESAIGNAAESAGFSASGHTVEISGRCPHCR